MSQERTGERGPAPLEARGRRADLGPRARQAAHPGLLGPLLLFLLASPASAATVEIEGGPLVLGRAPAATALIALSDAEEGRDGAAALRLAASAGRFGEPERVRPGLWRAVYTPPPTRFPQLAVVALWREVDRPEVEVLDLPLLGTTRLPVKAAPGAQATVEVGGQSFGPVAAGADGQAEVPLVVGPGVDLAIVRVKGPGAPALRRVRLEAPASNRLVAIPLLPARPGEPARLLVVYAGKGTSARALRVSASAGTVGPARSSGSVHAYAWTQPASTRPVEEVSFAVTAEGDPASRAEARLSLPRPSEPARPAAAPGVAAAAPLPPPGPLAPVAAAAQVPDPGPRTFLVGSRAGFGTSLDGLVGPRAGLELWSSLPPAALPAGYGLTLGVGNVSRPVGHRRGPADATLAPLALRLAWELKLGSRFVGRTGLGLLGAWALMRTPTATGSGLGHGGQVFLSGSFVVPSAEIFAETSLGRAPVRTAAGTAEAGGLWIEAGFRVGAF